MVTVLQCKEVARYLQDHYTITERRACEAAKLCRSVQRYQNIRLQHDALRQHIRDIAHTRFRYCYKYIHMLLRRECWQINHKWVHQLYCLKGSN